MSATTIANLHLKYYKQTTRLPETLSDDTMYMVPLEESGIPTAWIASASATSDVLTLTTNTGEIIQFAPGSGGGGGTLVAPGYGITITESQGVATIAVNTGVIATKSSVDTLSGTVANHTTSITGLLTAVGGKADKSYADNIKTTADTALTKANTAVQPEDLPTWIARDNEVTQGGFYIEPITSPLTMMQNSLPPNDGDLTLTPISSDDLTLTL